MTIAERYAFRKSMLPAAFHAGSALGATFVDNPGSPPRPLPLEARRYVTSRPHAAHPRSRQTDALLADVGLRGVDGLDQADHPHRRYGLLRGVDGLDQDS